MKTMKPLLLSLLLLGSLTAHAAITFDAPKRSPSTGEIGNAELIDEGGRRIPILGVIYPDSNGTTGISGAKYVAGKYSPVTGKEEPAQYLLANGKTVPLYALAVVNQATHVLQPFSLSTAASTLAGDVTGTIGASVVSLVAASTAANVHLAELAANAATAASTASTIVKRDASKGAAFGELSVDVLGKGLSIKEGSNARMGLATLVGGTVVVSTTAVAAGSRILLTSQTAGGTPGALNVSARTGGTSFTILSTSVLDTSDVAWVILAPL